MSERSHPWTTAFTVPPRLAQSARALGVAGEAWLAGLPDLLASLEADWAITAGAALAGGQAAYVAEAVTQDGTAVVLKVALPPGIDAFTPFERELAALRLTDGDPYTALIRHDGRRRALLLERLGRPMASLGWPVDRQLEALVHTAARGWRPVPTSSAPGQEAQPDPFPTGAESARWHSHFIPATWDELGRPCPEVVVDLALRCAAAREAAADPGRSVLIHGDVHAFNALQVGAGFRLVDPEGLLSEPAHDLGVIQARGVQGWTDELAASEPRRALEMVDGSCRHAGRLTGTDPEAIRQWTFVELVSTGLFLLSLGHHENAGTFLGVAGKLAAGAP